MIFRSNLTQNQRLTSGDRGYLSDDVVIFLIFLDFLIFQRFYFILKAHPRYLKNGVSKSIVHVINYAKFQLYMVHSDRVIWKK